jgi:hypothetical protein
VNLNLHLTTDTTDLRAEGYVLDRRLFAEVRWGFPDPPAGWGTVSCGAPQVMRRLAELAVQAAIQAEEEAAWHARGSRAAVEQRSRVA